MSKVSVVLSHRNYALYEYAILIVCIDCAFSFANCFGFYIHKIDRFLRSGVIKVYFCYITKSVIVKPHL